MKSKVLDRPMFKKGDEVDVENVGIMQGFKDMLGDEWDEEEGEEYADMNADEVSSRSPSSPEILMNNLRGDMRSVDARVEELADMVGYNAAVETPEAVLALLQPVLGAQEAMAAMPPMMPGGPAMPPGAPAVAPPQPPMPPGGIAALGGAMPPEMAAVPPMPMEAPAQAAPMQAPIQMRNGGLVQRFRNGSDEEGVTAQNISYPPDLVEKARSEIVNFLAQKPIAAPDLATEVERRVPLYQQVLGMGDRSSTQAQILFDIAQGGLNLAAGTTAGGQPLRGRQSAASRLASAFQALPSQIGARVGELEKGERQVRLAALQAAEKDIGSIREQNAKLVETQRKYFADVLKSSGTSVFGKGDWEWGIINRPGLLSRSLEGKTSTEEENLIQSAIAEFKNPIIEYRKDPDTDQLIMVQRNKTLPTFLQQYITAKERGTTQPAAAPIVPTAPAGEGKTAAPAAATGEAKPTTLTATGGTTITMLKTPWSSEGEKPQKVPPILAFSPSSPTMFNAAVLGTGGLFNIPAAYAERFPIVGAFVDAEKNIDRATFLRAAAGQINRVLSVGDRFTEGERKQIQGDVDLLPSLIDRPEAYQLRVSAIDTLLRQLRDSSYKIGYESPDISAEARQKARLRVREIDSVRSLLGAPPKIGDFPSIDDFNKLPVGSVYINQQGTFSYKSR